MDEGLVQEKAWVVKGPIQQNDLRLLLVDVFQFAEMPISLGLTYYRAARA